MKNSITILVLLILTVAATSLMAAPEKNEATDWAGLWLFIKVVAIIICGFTVLLNGCTHPTSLTIIGVFFVLWLLRIVSENDLGLAFVLVVMFIIFPFINKGK